MAEAGQDGWECRATGSERHLMSKPTFQQETKCHKNSGGGTSSGFLPSGHWARKKSGARKLLIPTYPASLRPHPPSRGAPLLPHTLPYPWLPYHGDPISLRAEGPHPGSLCPDRAVIERELGPLPASPSPLPTRACRPQHFREGGRGESGAWGNLPGLHSRQY